MCGLAGVLDSSGATAEALTQVVTEMADALAHRGPDDHGAWVDARAGIAFGHRRLAIIDLSPTGHQPMVSASGRYVLAYNGEIYNHRELRTELAALGVKFRGASDTEVLVEAIDRWGVRGALERLNGMFALAVWNRDERRLVLARDRLGEKPLYYGSVGTRFLFASELGALERVSGWSPSLDRTAARLFLRYGFVPHPWSIFEGIRQLPPATTLTIRADASVSDEPQPYWSLANVVQRGVGRRLNTSFDPVEAVDELEQLLTDAVGRRLVADVPVGAFLSGGIDSTTVVALARRTGPVRTFTVRIPDAGLDESADAARVAAHLDTDHTTVDLATSDALAAVKAVPGIYDEPFGDPSSIPTALVCRAAREHVTVCLSGDGGDEVFAGYNRHVLGRAVWMRARHVPLPLRRAGARVVGGALSPAWERAARFMPGVGHRVRDPVGKASKLAALLVADDVTSWWSSLAGLWGDDGAVLDVGSLPSPRDLAGAAPPFADPVEELVWLDTAVVLPDDMLVKVDRASMAASLELRVPLLDHRVVESAWTLPISAKVRDGRGKAILRDVLAKHVPRELTDRPKIGFDPPLGAWLRGPLRGWAEDLLDPRHLDAAGLVSIPAVRAAWAQHLAGKRDRTYDLWPLLCLGAWKESRWPTAW